MKYLKEYVMQEILFSNNQLGYETRQELIRCGNCKYWKPPHIRLNDGKQRAYIPGDKKKDPFGIGVSSEVDPFGIGVSSEVGINIGGKCWVDHNNGYGRDMRVFRNKDDFCGRADKLPEGTTSEEWWGLSAEPSELTNDFDY